MRPQGGVSSHLSEIVALVLALVLAICKVSQVHSSTDLSRPKQLEDFRPQVGTNFQLAGDDDDDDHDHDDEGAEEQQIRIDLGETKPIDLNLVRDNNNNDDDDVDDEDEKDESDWRREESSKPISGDNWEQLDAASWCNVDAELDGHCRHLLAHNYSEALEVCGSDGKLYASICDFRRRSCIRAAAAPDDGDYRHHHHHHHHLLRMESKAFCRAAKTWAATCSKPDEYRQFKLALVRQFAGDLARMFKHFDANGDNLIEARELWPKSRRTDEMACDESRRRGECAPFGGDFAFGRHFEWSSCSLSHLLLLENRTSFEWPQFVAAFAGFGSAAAAPPGDLPVGSSRRSRVMLNLGESRLVECLADESRATNESFVLGCQWTRYGTNVAALRDGHLSLLRDSPRRALASSLHLRDAQLYLSGPYKCSCSLNWPHSNSRSSILIEHLVEVQVLAPTRVSIRPRFQRSLPESRVAFECQHDFIDTNFDSATMTPAAATSSMTKQTKPTPEAVKINAPADYQLKWWRETENEPRQSRILGNKENEKQALESDNAQQQDEPKPTKTTTPIASCSSRASMPNASGKLVLERAQVNDSGRYYCQVEQLESLNVRGAASNSGELLLERPPAEIIMSQSNFGRLLIQAEARAADSVAEQAGKTSATVRHLWSFHENGISIYRLRSDESQDLELVRELAGSSQVAPEVEGNWNQLSTLCGEEPKSEQVFVSCEWSDNALLLEIPIATSGATPTHDDDDNDSNLANESNDNDNQLNRRQRPNLIVPTQKYVYIGQPNLNRVIVMDGHAHEVVAIINTEPQPRKLFAFKPNKIHLSKWVRRRLSPMANARWLKAIDDEQRQQQQQRSAAGQQQQSRAHPLELTPKSSRLYSDKLPQEATRSPSDHSRRPRRPRRHQTRRHPVEQPQPKLVQHDIWLLCYGKPLELEPTAVGAAGSGPDETMMRASNQEPSRPFRTSRPPPDSPVAGSNWAPPYAPLVSSSWPLIRPSWAPTITESGGPHEMPPTSSSSPPSFYSNPSMGTPQYSANKEARLRNRKSVQIIQSTFFPPFANPTAMHQHNKQQREQIDSPPSSSSPSSASQAVGKFKRLTVLTTHYVIANHGMSSIYLDNANASSSLLAAAAAAAAANGTKMSHHRRKSWQPHGPGFDLVQSLSVPQVPYSQQLNPNFKLHHAYVTHYDQRQLYRISMDGYRYDREIDLQNCDPLSLVLASQGLIIVQCRSPITHKLIGQLVLDELSSQIIQFNDNIQAHESCLTPDNRYLINIHTNQSSTIYVQSVKVDGLSLLYVIETALETTQCSFIWRDGYYAAIFVAINRRDKQSDLLSLRIADSRLEMIVRVPGLMTSSVRHKEPLNVEPDLQIVTLSTDSGVHVIDLEENRIVQSIDHHHQRSNPTLLWV